MVLAATACVQYHLFLTMLLVSLEDFQSSMVKYLCEVQNFNKTILIFQSYLTPISNHHNSTYNYAYINHSRQLETTLTHT